MAWDIVDEVQMLADAVHGAERDVTDALDDLHKGALDDLETRLRKLRRDLDGVIGVMMDEDRMYR
jgi:hypothetical protein